MCAHAPCFHVFAPSNLILRRPGNRPVSCAHAARLLAGAPLRGVEGHLRHASHVDAGRRQGRPRPGAAAQSLLGQRVAGDAARALHADAPPRRSLVHHAVRLRRPCARDRAVGRRGAHAAARAADRRGLLPRGDDDAGRHGAAGEDLAHAGRNPRSRSGSIRTRCTDRTIRSPSAAGGRSWRRSRACSRSRRAGSSANAARCISSGGASTSRSRAFRAGRRRRAKAPPSCTTRIRTR